MLVILYGVCDSFFIKLINLSYRLMSIEHNEVEFNEH